MIPAAFAYDRASSVDEALGAARYPWRRRQGHRRRPEPPAAHEAAPRPAGAADRHRPDRRAQGHAPSSPDGAAAIGPLTTYAELLADSRVMRLELFADALPNIADVQVRNRGTIGGSIAHADPAADMPALLLALDAERGHPIRTPGRAGRARRWLLPGSVHDGSRPRRAPHRDPASPRAVGLFRLGVPDARAAGVWLRDRRRGRSRRQDRVAGTASTSSASRSRASGTCRTGRGTSRTRSAARTSAQPRSAPRLRASATASTSRATSTRTQPTAPPWRA